MPKYYFFLFLLCCCLTVTGQEKYFSEEQISFERCGFMKEKGARINCYSKALNTILSQELNHKLNKDSLPPFQEFRTYLSVSLSESGEFRLDPIENDDNGLEPIFRSRISNLEKVLPVTDSLGQSISTNFKLQFLAHVNEAKEIVEGLPKKEVGGFGELGDAMELNVIEKVPVFPGCYETTNEGLKKCLSKKMQQLVSVNFDMKLVNKLDLEPGIQKIYVRFKIDKEGNIADIDYRASHPELGKEAKRVLNLTPQMTPGEHNGKKVSVIYALPIVFKVKETARQKRERLRKERKVGKKS